MKIRLFEIALAVFSLFLVLSCSRPDCPEPEPIETNTITITSEPSDPFAFIFSFAPTTPRPNETSIQATAWTISGTPFALRSLLDFDLSSIPSGATVQKATLILFSDTTGEQGLTVHKGHSTLSGSNSWILKKITSPWNENTVTWNTAPSTQTSDQLILPASTSDDQSYEIDITGFIKDELTSPSSYHGLMFQLVDESYYRAIQFCSPNTNFPELKPQLKIEYTS